MKTSLIEKTLCPFPTLPPDPKPNEAQRLCETLHSYAPPEGGVSKKIQPASLSQFGRSIKP